MSQQTGQPFRLTGLPSLEAIPFVSIVIAVLNEEAYIGQCLDSFIAQDYPPDRLEVIVADGGSGDRTREFVAEAAIRAAIDIRLIENPGRTTPVGLNAGVDVARGQVIVNFIGHAAAEPGFISANVEVLRTTGAAAVGGPIRTLGEGLIGTAIAAAVSNPFGVGDGRFRYSSRAAFVDTIAFGAYRRECFDLLGGFDTSRALAEDDSFNHEVRKAGGAIYLTPDVQSLYFSRASLRGLARQYWGYGRAKGRVAREDPSALSARHLVPSAAVLGGATLLLLSLFVQPARVVLALAAGLYGLAAIAAAFWPGRAPGRSFASRILTALVFPLLHISYGVGMLTTILRSSRR